MDQIGQKVWGVILSSIKSQVLPSAFKAWFSGSFVLDYKLAGNKKLLIIGVKNNFLKEQVETRYSPMIFEAKNKHSLGDVEIVFVVANKEQGSNSKSGPLFTGVAQKIATNGKRADALSLNYTLGNFTVGYSNNLAYMAAKKVAENPGGIYNPLLFYGPTGVGKTHLLQAIGNEVSDKIMDAKVLYVTAERFTNDYIESLNNKTQQFSRQKYRSVDLLLVDDAQFLAGKESTQDEFFHTFNELCLSGRQVVIASDRHPSELARVKERLVSRFLGGMTADIGYPDLEMKIAILVSKCKQKNIKIDREILAYIAGECQGGARELEGVLIATLAQLKLSGGKSNLNSIKELISKNKPPAQIKVSPGKIIGAVCKHFRIEEALLCSASRRAKIVGARQLLMYLLRRDLGLSLSAIGSLVGGRDHSTVIHGIGKVEKMLGRNLDVRDEIYRIGAIFNK
ncbi:chromosomal replication initiator protein DnaA [Candidatus Curtissbacteria bacterium RIFCSPLOWO2_01_FULL_41_18]|uniref:Chromosomal replication initiator protein DnaA n=1 Tax=Candidatus Curtissbacteria bacterium RIFCSPLOWO2_01_FULL_41_18 TaxID=1797727 RepID=A0A1F5HK37_9BACT|nr:MAG: chromosomal replication initiator protein DnaA [Candidatus Curtissbacteria bacterium RIFCSPLOWO2_01_FULL_41_18]